jgi:anthranilate phosphoribosyltransferase
VHGDGTDELSTTGPSDVREVTAGEIREFTVEPQALGLPQAQVGDLRGSDRVGNARLLTAILDGSEAGPKRDVVLLNAAAGFVITGLAADLGRGLDLAREQIASGRARQKLSALQEFSARAAD